MIEQFPKEVQKDVEKVFTIIECFGAHKGLYYRQKALRERERRSRLELDIHRKICGD